VSGGARAARLEGPARNPHAARSGGHRHTTAATHTMPSTDGAAPSHTSRKPIHPNRSTHTDAPPSHPARPLTILHLPIPRWLLWRLPRRSLSPLPDFSLADSLPASRCRRPAARQCTLRLGWPVQIYLARRGRGSGAKRRTPFLAKPRREAKETPGGGAAACCAQGRNP